MQRSCSVDALDEIGTEEEEDEEEEVTSPSTPEIKIRRCSTEVSELRMLSMTLQQTLCTILFLVFAQTRLLKGSIIYLQYRLKVFSSLDTAEVSATTQKLSDLRRAYISDQTGLFMVRAS